MRERQEEGEGEGEGRAGKGGLRAFLFSLADRTTNTDVEKPADSQPFLSESLNN